MTSRTGWFVGLGIVIVLFCAWVASLFWPVVAMLGDPARVGRTWYVASQSMVPTLLVNDRVRPLAVGSARIGRGTIVLVATDREPRLYRVAAIASDHIGIREGQVILNGRPVTRHRLAAAPLLVDGARMIRWCERFPGEAGEHQVLWDASGPATDFAPVSIPKGSLFLLGDNRDRSADSRYGAEESGVGVVRSAAVIGIVDRILWGSYGSRRARPVDQDACR